jgi:hypothetical protein
VCKWLSNSYAGGHCDRRSPNARAFTLKASSRTAIGHPGRDSIEAHACTLYTLVTTIERLRAYPHLLLTNASILRGSDFLSPSLSSLSLLSTLCGSLITLILSSLGAIKLLPETLLCYGKGQGEAPRKALPGAAARN